MDVPVRPGHAGTVLVGYRPAAPAGAGIVLIAGGQTYVDPTAPDDPPFTLVHDAVAAREALVVLHGPAVADAVEVLFGDPSPAAVDAEIRPGDAAVPLRRMGLVRWLERHSPDALSPALLDLEFGAAGVELEDVLDRTELDEAESRLRRRAGFLAGLSRRLRDGGPSTPPVGLAGLVADALPRTHGVLSFASAEFDDVLHELELAAALERFGTGGGPVDWSALAGLPGIGGRELATAGWRDRDADHDPGRPRTASVDWLLVPRGVLATDEDTVRWRLVDDGARVEVAVRAAPDAPAADLAFRLYSDERPLPIAVGLLRPADGGDSYTGGGPLHAPATGELTLDVHDRSVPASPRLGADAVDARAARWAARGVAALRIGGSSADDAAEQALDEGAHHYSRSAARRGDGRARTLALRREVRCRAVQSAVAGRTGVDVPDLEVVAPVAAVDARYPDLAGDGWTPLAAETALGVDRVWRE